jgi:hypothetical protein
MSAGFRSSFFAAHRASFCSTVMDLLAGKRGQGGVSNELRDADVLGLGSGAKLLALLRRQPERQPDLS